MSIKLTQLVSVALKAAVSLGISRDTIVVEAQEFYHEFLEDDVTPVIKIPFLDERKKALVDAAIARRIDKLLNQ